MIVANPADAERIARRHTQKDGSFNPILFDSVIATQDNEHWREQRKALSEVFDLLAVKNPVRSADLL